MDGIKSPSNDGYKFNTRQSNAIELFARGFTYDQISEELSVDRKTLARWKKLPGFEETVELIRHAVNSKRLKEFDGRMGQLELEAIEVMAAIMKDPNAKVPDRLAAARGILTHQNGRKAQSDNQVMVSFGGMPVISSAENKFIEGEVGGR